MYGTALMTTGRLKKGDLKYNKRGRIVSKKRSARAKREKRLEKAGYKTKKGVFGAIKKDRSSKKRYPKKSFPKSKLTEKSKSFRIELSIIKISIRSINGSYASRRRYE